MKKYIKPELVSVTLSSEEGFAFGIPSCFTGACPNGGKDLGCVFQYPNPT